MSKKIDPTTLQKEWDTILLFGFKNGILVSRCLREFFRNYEDELKKDVVNPTDQFFKDHNILHAPLQYTMKMTATRFIAECMPDMNKWLYTAWIDCKCSDEIMVENMGKFTQLKAKKKYRKTNDEFEKSKQSSHIRKSEQAYLFVNANKGHKRSNWSTVKPTNNK